MRFLFLAFLVCFGVCEEIFTPIPPPSFNKEKALLGKELYFDTSLGNGASCDSCHNLYVNKSGSSHKTIKGKNPPSVINSATKLFFYKDANVSDITEQVRNSLLSPEELNVNRDELVRNVAKNKRYKMNFDKRFTNGVTFENIVEVLVEFEKSLSATDSKFDRFLLGEYEFNVEEKRGFDVFLDYGCVNCHNGVNLGDNLISDSIINEKVKVPSLRNIMSTAPYFYSGEAKDIKDAIIFKTSIKFLNINDREIHSLLSFLRTLDGKVEIINEK